MGSIDPQIPQRVVELSELLEPRISPAQLGDDVVHGRGVRDDGCGDGVLGYELPEGHPLLSGGHPSGGHHEHAHRPLCHPPLADLQVRAPLVVGWSLGREHRDDQRADLPPGHRRSRHHVLRATDAARGDRSGRDSTLELSQGLMKLLPRGVPRAGVAGQAPRDDLRQHGVDERCHLGDQRSIMRLNRGPQCMSRQAGVDRATRAQLEEHGAGRVDVRLRRGFPAPGFRRDEAGRTDQDATVGQPLGLRAPERLAQRRGSGVFERARPQGRGSRRR